MILNLILSTIQQACEVAIQDVKQDKMILFRNDTVQENGYHLGGEILEVILIFDGFFFLLFKVDKTES